MPTLAVARDYLFHLMGKNYTEEQFEDVCFKFGVELDDVTSEREMFSREQGMVGGANLEELSDEVIYKIDTPANRYDLQCAEGMAVALNVFLGLMRAPAFKVLNRCSPLYRMTVDKSVRNVRDYVVCAVLKNICLNERSYRSFIDFQEKLHSGLARRRTLASVGTHDLDKIGDNNFIYTLKSRESIRFVPLNQRGRMLDCAGDGLAEFYKDDRQISKYVPLISGLSHYPVIMDREKQSILSLPPIINSDFSCISQETKNIFIECTAPDHYKANVLVNQIVCAFSTYCEEPFTVEAVRVEYEEATPDGTKVEVTPNLDPAVIPVYIPKVERLIGIKLDSPQHCGQLLERMLHRVAKMEGDNIFVEVPATRPDVLGPTDLMEDVAIAYGYDNIKYVECTTRGKVTQQPLSKLSHLLRIEMANAGYTELLTFSLCSRDEAFAHLNREDDDVAVHIANPRTMEFQICRPSLMPGILKTLNANKSHPLPLRFFECSDVVLIDNEKNFPPLIRPHSEYPNCGACNQRHVAALHCCSENSGFEDIHGLVEFIMKKLSISRKGEQNAEAEEDTYTLERGTDGAFFPGRCMDIFLHRKDQKVCLGGFGVVHPNTLRAYDIPFPCSYMEINIQFAQ
ncbi:putative phenylalanyl-tRNA synthetase [Trypanosoma cruzi]|uniref:phenylalanine--tRNA ligase n=2 Tax=Trypanosoma cruzi TaxID=5693 RepID=Q4DP96_TRYCC|nr:phenylalanyl-tRNA synthetase, putative [Trypanosoma cruzi]EAN94336.1 phenylalanyl-tRNA synthetase, putative [Trypanosoma cruzi]PWV19548.1 putative phenylalanyl-tRNA synthetase [Trypanosoma cruzi]|eukprot:XP_816187.1 phenylalanyl-tRNA synthetase [Trypanosoma cruzi strain CL Brener]